jgi:hypothetical protein
MHSCGSGVSQVVGCFENLVENEARNLSTAYGTADNGYGL